MNLALLALLHAITIGGPVCCGRSFDRPAFTTPIFARSASLATPSPAPTQQSAPAPSVTLSSSPSTPPQPSPAPSLTPSPEPSQTAAPSPSPIVPPRDAPPVRETTPPFAAPHLTALPRPPDSLWLGSETSATVPMTIRGGRPYINAILNGHPATLLVDTSAITTLVDGDLLSADPARASISLQIQQLRFPHLSPATAPVRAYTEANLGEPADLIVGADLLSRYPVQFDFPDRTLTIYRDSQSAASAMPKTAITTVMRTIDGRPAVQGTLDGDAGLWFSLATGAPGDISLEPGADGAARLIRQLSLPYDVITPAGTMNGRLVRAKTFVLGGVTFYQPLVGIVNAQRPGSELSGALCADLLSRLDLFVDQSASTVSFVAGPTATSALLYDPSGILLAVRRGAIAIRTVVPGSPAEQARLRRGDEIVSINGLVPATLEFARALLDGNPGSKVLVVYRRWDSTKSTTLVLRVLI